MKLVGFKHQYFKRTILTKFWREGASFGRTSNWNWAQDRIRH